MKDRKEKLVYLCTHGSGNPEKATLPFAMALGAMSMDMEAVVMLQSEAVLLGKKDVVEHVFAAGMSPLKELMNLFLADGGTLIACTACLAARNIDQSTLDERIVLGSVARLAKEFSEARNVICY